MAEQVRLHVFDPDSLSRLHHLFHSCWDEVRTDISSSLVQKVNHRSDKRSRRGFLQKRAGAEWILKSLGGRPLFGLLQQTGLN